MAKGKKTGGRVKGTPNKATADIKAVAQEYGELAVRKLAALAGLVEGQAAAESEQAQSSACTALLDRGYGKPSQMISGDPENPTPISVIERVIVGHAQN